MTTLEILNQRNEKGILSFTNESAGWYGISRDNTHIIYFADDSIKMYKNEKSFAIKIAKLINTGY